MINYSFKKFLNPAALVGTLNKLPPLHTQVLDLVYPESAQVNHPFDTIGYEDLQATCKNIPLVSRGSSSYALGMDANKLKFIDPANLTPSQLVSAADINRLRNLPEASAKQFLSTRIERLRRAVRSSKEALAIQSLTGKISYDLRNVNGTFEKYDVDFGQILTQNISVKWNASGAKASTMISDIGKIVAEIKKKSSANTFIGFVDFDTFAVMADLVNNASTKLPIETSYDKIIICGTAIYPTAASYYDYSAKANVPLVAAKKIKIVGVDDGFSFFNCALDSVDANFAALPFAIREIVMDDPEAIKLIGMARPMPIPNVNAICDAVVLS